MRVELQKINEEAAVILPEKFLKECGINDAVDINVENGRIVITSSKFKKDRPENFVNFVMKFCIAENKAALAALKCADNPKKQEKSYDYLAPFYIDFNSPNEVLPYATIAAAIAKTNSKENGHVGIGRAIARCYDTIDKNDNKKEIDPQAKVKIRRLLACDSTEEVRRVLRSLFSLIESRNVKNINYVSLLRDLESFHLDWKRELTKQYWAKDFYNRVLDKDGEND
jgi:CRISPR system Cascade subunit CasB